MAENIINFENEVADIIANSCMLCDCFWYPTGKCPCICQPVSDTILYVARLEKEQEFISEWKRQQVELQKLYGKGVE